jgi:RNA-binding protein
MNLTGKQKSFLRSKAQVLKPVFQIGKEGFSKTFQDSITNYLLKNELLKFSILDTCSLTKEAIIKLLVDNDFEVVQSIGKTLVIFKENPNLEKGIELPR